MFLIPLGIDWILAAILTQLDGRKRWVIGVACGGLAISSALLVGTAIQIFNHGEMVMVAGDWPRGVGITVRADALGITFAVLINLLLLFALIYEATNQVDEPSFPALVMFLGAGLTGLFLTGDAFNFYVFFEISMTTSFLIASYGQKPKRLRNALIFTVVNLLGSIILLSGVVGLYHLTGTLDMQQVSQRIGSAAPADRLIVATLFFVAFSLKLGLFPFHFWLPSVYRGVRPVSAAILGGVLANLGSYGLLRFGGEILYSELKAVSIPLFVIGSISILYGAFVAVSRRTEVETLAYSSISQVGYVILALAIGGPVGFAAAVVYSVVNAIEEVLMFATSGLRGWLVGAAFVIGAFSIAGVPPTAGFFAKASVFKAGVSGNYPALVVIIFLGGALSLVYMFQVYQQIFWVQKTERSAPFAARFMVLLLAVVVIALGVYPELLLSIGQQAASVLGGAHP